MRRRLILPALSAAGTVVSVYGDLLRGPDEERGWKVVGHLVQTLSGELAIDDRAPLMPWKLERLDVRARSVYGLRALLAGISLLIVWRDLRNSRRHYERELRKWEREQSTHTRMRSWRPRMPAPSIRSRSGSLLALATATPAAAASYAVTRRLPSEPDLEETGPLGVLSGGIVQLALAFNVLAALLSVRKRRLRPRLWIRRLRCVVMVLIHVGQLRQNLMTAIQSSRFHERYRREQEERVAEMRRIFTTTPPVDNEGQDEVEREHRPKPESDIGAFGFASRFIAIMSVHMLGALIRTVFGPWAMQKIAGSAAFKRYQNWTFGS